MNEPEQGHVEWRDDKTPVSKAFGDVYYSLDDAVAESLYVFVDGCSVPKRLEKAKEFTICETGFGTGLNFLLTWRAWEQANPGCHLHYISVEAFPLSKEDLKAALSHFPELENYANQLIAAYDAQTNGFHAVHLGVQNLRLTLLIGDAAKMFDEFEGKADAWYLDGFAPSKNPDMWSDSLFDCLAQSSAQGCVVSTFTAAGFVKRALIDRGFEMSKRKGFGRKRDSLIGVFRGAARPDPSPWFDRGSRLGRNQKIAVIGAGIAGCLSARRLQEGGHEVEVFERADHVGAQGSGNVRGIIKPRLARDQKGVGRFNTIAYQNAVRFYDSLEKQGIKVWETPRGLFHMSEDADDLAKLTELYERAVLPQSEMTFLSADQASEKLGVPVPRAGLWYDHAGIVTPGKLCQSLSEALSLNLNSEITEIRQSATGWQLFDREKKCVFDGDAVVLATAGQTGLLASYCTLPMGGRRGQVSYVAHSHDSVSLSHAISGGGYILPAVEGRHLVGASFERWADFDDLSFTHLSRSSEQDNLDKAQKLIALDVPQADGGRASIRAMTADHMPIVGPVFKEGVFLETYKGLEHGPKGKTFAKAPYVPGLYVITGLGSRGVQTAPLLSEMLCAYINGTPFPIERTLRACLHPARFLIRDLKKGRR